jgi:hypothetical protein
VSKSDSPSPSKKLTRENTDALESLVETSESKKLTRSPTLADSMADFL